MIGFIKYKLVKHYMKKKLGLIILLALSLKGYSQTYIINGLLKDSISGIAIKGSTVQLNSSTNKNLKENTLSDENGNFLLKNIPSGKYELLLSAIGFKNQVLKVEVNNQNKELGNIFVSRSSQSLENITVISAGAAVTQKDDTAQFNSRQYKTNPDATTEDLVKKMPGITVDNNGNITAQGEQVKKVTVDGKEFFGNDVNAALKNIPAVAVEKIQVYDKMSDQSQMTGIDDGNSQKAINIITKAGIKDAQFGRVYAGMGTNQTYTGGGNVSFFKNERRISLVGNFNNINQQNFASQDILGLTGSKPYSFMGSNRGPGAPVETYSIDQANGISVTNALGINYGDKWGPNTNVTGSYFFNQSNNKNTATSNTKIFSNNLNIFKDGSTDAKNYNHRINARIEYKLNTNDMIFIIPSISFQNNNSVGSNYLLNFRNTTDTLSASKNNFLKNKDGYNIRNNIMYRHSFEKKNRIFTIGLNTNFNKNNGNTGITGMYKFYDDLGAPIIPDSLQNQNLDNPTNGYTIGANITYNEPLGKKGRGQFQIEYNPSIQKNNADQNNYTFSESSSKTLDSNLSNQFKTNIITQNGGLTYRFNPNKDEQMGINVNYQYATMESDRIFPSQASVNYHFQNILPYAFWRKKINQYSNIRTFYRASVNFPTINQLQDVVNLSNPLFISAGNKFLKQSFTQYVGWRFTHTNTKTNQSLFGGMFFQTADEYISNETFIADKDSLLQEGIVLKKGTQLTKPVNLNGYRLLRSSVTYSFPLKPIKSNINLNSFLIYTETPGLINHVKTSTNTFLWNLGLGLVSNVSEYVDYNISYNVNVNKAKTIGTLINNNNYINQSVSVVFNLLNKKGYFIQNDFSTQIFKGLSSGFDRTFNLWNASIGKKFFKNKSGELKLSVFDILKQNQSLVRTVTNSYLEDTRSKVLQQYYMLTFSYNLKNFGNGKKQEKVDDFIPKVGYPNQ